MLFVAIFQVFPSFPRKNGPPRSRHESESSVVFRQVPKASPGKDGRPLSSRMIIQDDHPLESLIHMNYIIYISYIYYIILYIIYILCIILYVYIYIRRYMDIAVECCRNVNLKPSPVFWISSVLFPGEKDDVIHLVMSER